MTSLVEEAVSVGSMVSIFRFHQSGAHMHEYTLPADAPVIGYLISQMQWPPHTVLAAILRDYRPVNPDEDERFEPGDELIFLTAREGEDQIGLIPQILSTQPALPTGAIYPLNQKPDQPDNEQK